MNILVTGSQGYIGSATAHTLIQQGHTVVGIDERQNIINTGATEHTGDLTDHEFVDTIFTKNTFDAVIHFGAYKSVEESTKDASKYAKNIEGLLTVLRCMIKHNVTHIVFSSSAAVYGQPDVDIMTEDTPTAPINMYGYTKLCGEQLLDWFTQVHNISAVSLRYFNVAGDIGLRYREQNVQNILPIILEVVEQKREQLTIFGTDYPTKDGTCVRDYIHLHDLVDAHIKALAYKKTDIINLGTGTGTSVQELVDAVQDITGQPLPHINGPRRAGDPAGLIASNTKAQQLLNWRPVKTIHDIVTDTLNVRNTP